MAMMAPDCLESGEWCFFDIPESQRVLRGERRSVCMRIILDIFTC